MRILIALLFATLSTPALAAKPPFTDHEVECIIAGKAAFEAEAMMTVNGKRDRAKFGYTLGKLTTLYAGNRYIGTVVTQLAQSNADSPLFTALVVQQLCTNGGLDQREY